MGIRTLSVTAVDGANNPRAWSGAKSVNEPTGCPRKRCPLTPTNETEGLTLETTVGDLPLGKSKLVIRAEDIMGQTRTLEKEIVVFSGAGRSDSPINYDLADPDFPDYIGDPYANFGLCTSSPAAPDDPDPAYSYCGENDLDNPVTAEAASLPALTPDGQDGGISAQAIAPNMWGISTERLRYPNGTPYSADPNFSQLNLGWARKIVPFDLEPRRATDPAEAAELDDWLENLGPRRPLVSFQRSNDPSGNDPGNWPAIADYVNAFRAFRAAHPQVRHFTAWNEPNLRGAQPLACFGGQSAASCASYARRAGIYYRYMRDECNTPPPGLARCTVLAGDFIDEPRDLTRAYVENYLDGARSEPRLWAYHAYTAARRRTRRTLSLFMKLTRGDVWLTEQGGIFQNLERDPDDKPGEQWQAADTDWLLRWVVPYRQSGQTQRIKAFFYYQWDSLGERFDTGLINPGSLTVRTAYNCFRNRTNSEARPCPPQALSATRYPYPYDGPPISPPGY